MNANAVVETQPVLVREEPALQGHLVARTYRMAVRPHEDEPIKNFKPGEIMTFTLTGVDPDPRDIVPGTALNITIITRGPGRELIGIGINLERYGCCDNCEREGTVQFTPERPSRNHCKHCVSRMWDEAVTFPGHAGTRGRPAQHKAETDGTLGGSAGAPRGPGSEGTIRDFQRPIRGGTGIKAGPEE